jgi:hypothetical protein
MRLQLTRSCANLLLMNVACFAAAPIELELATERGVQITAPHDWLQLLAAIGIEDVRIRGMQPGDELKAENRGTSVSPRYHVLGFLTAGDQLRLPGGSFSRSDRAAIKDYFDRLSDDGAEALTAPRGRFGLTARELALVTADLAQPIDFQTRHQLLDTVIGKLNAKFTIQSLQSPSASSVPELRKADRIVDELQGLTAGTGLAIILRNYGYALRPNKERARPLSYDIIAVDRDELFQSTLGETDDFKLQQWPIGWKADRLASKIVPELFEPRNAEIQGYTLEETLQAIGSRVKIPFYVDHAALRAARIDLATVQVQIARSRISYKRVLDRALSQARLYCQIRVDEAGTPFLWITR